MGVATASRRPLAGQIAVSRRGHAGGRVATERGEALKWQRLLAGRAVSRGGFTIMSSVIYVFGSGLAFFIGICVVLAGVVSFVLSQKRWARALAFWSVVVGGLLIALSATPLPYWFYATAGSLTLRLLDSLVFS
jgi:hypothetical protein